MIDVGKNGNGGDRNFGHDYDQWKGFRLVREYAIIPKDLK